MAQIKAVSVSFDKESGLLVVDSEGRLWVRSVTSGEWSKESLPDDEKPDPRTNTNRLGL